MDSERAARYASLSPEEFVKTRFYTEEIGVLDHISDGLTKVNSMLGVKNNSSDERPVRPAISEDGRTVISRAYYNDVNYHQLTQPRQNLQMYCEAARRGQWNGVRRYTDDPIAAAQSDLFAVYTETELQVFDNLQRQNGDSGYAPAEAELAATAAAIATRRAATRNELIASAYAGSGFRKAIDEGAFGVFRCDEATSSWSVSVLPLKFYPSLDVPSILVGIRQFRAEE
ncbi:hypothetical protein ATI61_101875 [Archangium gephyra]|uniref:Uncharacterized protein n=2 Tax=Archangium gephyra TaxID=48 RepID=A0AAC8QAA2_9BACT|nr:Hypothetical protein AA314_05656 [Archangium gephyra]REG37886.1 hypothetical protein ATI61_101875 [Archangium gephyra]